MSVVEEGDNHRPAPAVADAAVVTGCGGCGRRVALVAAAAIDLTVDDAGSQIAVLVAAGVLLLVLPLLLDRAYSVSLGPSARARNELHQAVVSRSGGHQGGGAPRRELHWS